ncbi:hypothetical protein L484_000387 [Morus notabilis]|uniref:Uncharacterized protein n=1 Tax=Morus notabilis TaxID=981085 RepID=W9SE67_9ROSA|nr:hypothetical protein L484_000387 [Morus notabilis]
MNAKSMIDHRTIPSVELPHEVVEMVRYGSLSSDFNKLSYYATKVPEFYRGKDGAFKVAV